MESAALTFIVFLRWLRYQENFSPGRKGGKKWLERLRGGGVFST